MIGKTIKFTGDAMGSIKEGVILKEFPKHVLVRTKCRMRKKDIELKLLKTRVLKEYRKNL
jgi:hypothetical protein